MDMPTCFVIQPFDGGTFDKRYEDLFKPAIEAAGLEPYRVDLDPNVVVPINSIEEGIKAATACLADITTDNPNVWYELGYSFAATRPVLMVCAVAERKGKKYPFDIQHRAIIQYATDAPRDFDKLKTEITTRLKAMVGKANALQQIGKSQQIAPIEGLGQLELAVLAAAAGSVMSPGQGVPIYALKRDLEESGFTGLGFSLGLHRLLDKGFVDKTSAEDEHGNPYDAIALADKGWLWISRNEDKFTLKRPAEPARENDLPF